MLNRFPKSIAIAAALFLPSFADASMIFQIDTLQADSAASVSAGNLTTPGIFAKSPTDFPVEVLDYTLSDVDLDGVGGNNDSLEFELTLAALNFSQRPEIHDGGQFAVFGGTNAGRIEGDEILELDLAVTSINSDLPVSADATIIAINFGDFDSSESVDFSTDSAMTFSNYNGDAPSLTLTGQDNVAVQPGVTDTGGETLFFINSVDVQFEITPEPGSASTLIFAMLVGACFRRERKPQGTA